MNHLNHNYELLKSKNERNYLIKRNKIIGGLGIAAGALIFASSLFPLVKEAKYMNNHPNYNPIEEKLVEIVEKFKKRVYTGGGVAGVSTIYLIPGIIIPLRNHRRRKKSLDKQLEDN